jgi:hypothetical protein
MKNFVRACALAVWLCGCATQTGYVPKDAPASVTPAQVKVGDFWEYRVTDGYTGFDYGIHRYEVSYAGPDRVVVDVTQNGERVDALVYAPGWNGLEHPLRNLQRFRYSPPYPAYDYPLAPGKTWYTVVVATDPATQARYRVHTQGKVIGWERIKVPAGEFDALKIKRYVFAGNPGWFTSQEEIDETDWYAPAVGRSVRSEGMSQHFDSSQGGGDEGGGAEYPMRIRGDWFVAELVRSSR